MILDIWEHVLYAFIIKQIITSETPGHFYLRIMYEVHMWLKNSLHYQPWKEKLLEQWKYNIIVNVKVAMTQKNQQQVTNWYLLNI